MLQLDEVRLPNLQYMNIARQWLCIFVAALSLALLLHIDVVINHFHTSSEKVGVLISGPRTDVGDGYYYFTLLKHAPERFNNESIRSDDPDGGDHRNINTISSSYATALIASNLLYQVAEFLAPTSRSALLFTSIMLTTVFALSFAIFVLTLQYEKCQLNPFSVFVLMALGLVFVGTYAAGIHFGKFVWGSAIIDSYTTRLVNPPMFWSVGLIAGAFIIRWIRSNNLSDFIATLILVALVGLFSISVSATLIFALGMTSVFEYFSTRKISKQFTGIFIVAVAALAWNMLGFYTYKTSVLGQDLRHGDFLTPVFTWQHLLILGMVPLLWRSLGRERVFVISLVLSSIVIGLVCESFHLGGRLWLRGSVIFEWVIIVFLTINLISVWITPNSTKLVGKLWPKLITVTISVLIMFFLQQPDTNSWKGFISRDKWEIYDWMDKHLPVASVVVSSDIEDAFLLPIYTTSKPLYTMRGLTNRSLDESLRRYLYNMTLFERKDQTIEQLLQLKQADVDNYIKFVYNNPQMPYIHVTADVVIFLHLVVYYAYSKDFSKMLIDLNQRRHFMKILSELAEETTVLNYSYDYALLTNDLPVPHMFLNWEEVYQNKQYNLVRNPELSQRGLP
jgi:hypothetical protein